jgi:hypothetical protein
MIIEINQSKFDCKEDGTILRWMKTNRWKEIELKANHIKGYNVISINKKQYMRSQIIAHAFLNYDLNDKNVIIYYLDSNKLNNHKDNLKIKRKENSSKQTNKLIIKQEPSKILPCLEILHIRSEENHS